MAFVKMPLKDAQPPEVLPEGKYTLLIEQVDIVEEDSGKSHVSLRHSVVGEPDAAAVFHRLPITLPEDPHSAKWSMLFCKAYLKLIGLEFKASGYDPEAIDPGTQFDCFLQIREYEGVKSNQIKLNPQDGAS